MSENAQAVTEPGRLSKRQALLAAAMADPKVKTLRQASEIAGYSHASTASESLAKPIVRAELERLKAERADKARGFKPKAERLLHRALDRADNLDPLEQSQIAGSTLKLVHDLGETEAVPDLERFELWKRRFALKCYAVGYRAGQKTLDVVLSPHNDEAENPAPSLNV